MNQQLIQNITWSLICAKADIDFETDITKREHAAELEETLVELLK